MKGFLPAVSNGYAVTTLYAGWIRITGTAQDGAKKCLNILKAFPVHNVKAGTHSSSYNMVTTGDQ
jgi:hypothetical protein